MKYLVIIGDGMADFPLEELGGQTPLQAARKPHIDRISREGFCGQVITVPAGFPPGSDVACMSLFGYDPQKYYTGRAPIEAYGMGVAIDEGDVAFRCNLVYLDVRAPKVFMGDYSAGHITIGGSEGPHRGLRQRGRGRGIQVLPRRRLPPPHGLEGRVRGHGHDPSP